MYSRLAISLLAPRTRGRHPPPVRANPGAGLT